MKETKKQGNLTMYSMKALTLPNHYFTHSIFVAKSLKCYDEWLKTNLSLEQNGYILHKNL